MSEHNSEGQSPQHPEWTTEDPMHGPSAVHNMLQTPAMPRGDGTYYQPGAFYAHGTPYVDSQGRPVFRIRIGDTGMATILREFNEVQEWSTAYRQGGNEALTALEAGRQLERLERTGFAHCFKPSDVCPGRKRLEDCGTGGEAYAAAQEWAAKNNQEKPGDGIFENVLAWAGRTCVECSVSCQTTVKTVDGKPEEARVSFYKPGIGLPVVELSLISIPSISATDLNERGLYGKTTEADTEEGTSNA